MKTKTTEKDFEYFKKCFMDLIHIYKLNNWEFTFEHKYLKDHTAYVEPDFEEETAKVGFSTDWMPENDEEYLVIPATRKNIRKAARHEARHVLLCPLAAMLERYNAEKDEIAHCEHIIINKLERADQPSSKRSPTDSAK